jgi:hypothetical protein
MRIAPHQALEKLGRAYLTAVKVMLLVAAIAVFLPIVFRAALRRYWSRTIEIPGSTRSPFRKF